MLKSLALYTPTSHRDIMIMLWLGVIVVAVLGVICILMWFSSKVRRY